MFSPISSSGTAWIAPPDARAAATREVAVGGVADRERAGDRVGRTGVTGRVLREGRPRRVSSPAAWPPISRGALAVDEPELD